MPVRFNATDSAILDRLVADCDRFDFDTKTSLLYIENRFRPINRDTFFARRRRLVSDGIINDRLYRHIKVGFAVEHFKMIDNIEWALKVLNEKLLQEQSKPNTLTKRPDGTTVEPGDKTIMIQLAHEIKELTETKRALILDTPFISQMKAELNKIRTITLPKGDSDKPSALPEKIDYGPPPESAAVVPPDSIAGKPPDISDEDNPEDDEPVVE